MRAVTSIPQKGLGHLKVAIVGCGTAGQAAALFLHRYTNVGSITLFDKWTDSTAVGAGLLLQPSGQLALQRLGLLQKARTHGGRVDRLWGTTPYSGVGKPGRTVLDLRYGDHIDLMGEVSHGVGIHRSTLFHVLYDDVKRIHHESPQRLNLRLGVDVQSVENKQTSPQLICSNGDRHGPFDFVIVAEGSSSRLRDDHCPAHLFTAPVYPWGAFWCVVTDEEKKFGAQLRQVYEGCSTMVGVLPIGKLYNGASHTGEKCEKELLSFFWSVPHADMEKVKQRGIDAWRSDVLRKWPDLEGLLAQVPSMDFLAKAKYRDVLMSKWHHDKMLYIGDAAHGTSPQLGQGANMALVDAMVLADALNKSSESENVVQTTFEKYNHARKQHLWYYQTASRMLTPVFQSHSRTIGALRDAFMGPMCTMPFVRNQMVKTLVGMQSGILGTWAPPE